VKAVIYDKPEQFTVREVPDPVAGPHQVLLRVLAAGVCGTDLHLHHGEFDPVYPLTPGHEMVGEVIQCGTAVSRLQVGQRVVVDNMSACGSCTECRRARPAYCNTLVAQGVNAPGGFAELVVAAEGKCFVVDDLPVDVAVFAEPTACIVHGLDVLALQPGSQVLLFGAGPSGLILAQLLAGSGASSLTVAAPTRAKLDLAAAHGADHVVQLDRNSPGAATEQLRTIAPDGFDVVVDATGVVGILDLAVPLTRVGGTVFVYGMAGEKDRWSVSPYDIFRREIVVRGSFAQQFAFDRAVLALRTGRVNTEGMITHRFPLHSYADALGAITDSSCIKAVIVPT
jgi:D-arabinitol dehydrogenase (NADP+)